MTNRLLVVALAAPLLACTGTALADSATGTQNPALTVTVSLSPDTVSAGDTITETKTVKNNTTHPLEILLVKTLKTPKGEVFRDTLKDRIGAGKTQTSTHTFKVGNKLKAGDYKITFTAADKKGKSTATATTEVE